MINVIGCRQINIGHRIAKNIAVCGVLLAGSTSGAWLPFQASPALAKPPLPTTEVWPGRRVVFLLPLQLSDNWNADPLWGKRLLVPSEQRLRTALENTGKFSVVQPYQFDPILQRALQEKRIDKTQLDAWVATPNIQTAGGVMDKMGFALAPLVAEFRLEEVRASGDAKAPSVQVQVMGKLYELNSQAAGQTKVFTSDPIRRRGSQFDQILEAAANAFQMVANDFVRPPGEIELPRVEPATPPATPAGNVKPPAKNGKTTKPVTPAPAPGTGETTAPAPVPPVVVPVTPPPTVIGPPPQGPINPQFNGNSGGQIQRAP